MEGATELVCGIHKKPLRRGEGTHVIRVTAEDLATAKPELDRINPDHSTEPGLYQVSEETFKILKPIVQLRLSAHYKARNDKHEAENPGHRNARPYPEIPEAIGGHHLL
jgi:hypothetical protein